MSVLRDIKTKCISFLELLRKLGQRLVNPLVKKREKKRTTRRSINSMMDARERLRGKEKHFNVEQCSFKGTQALDTTQKRSVSCPLLCPLYTQMETEHGDGVALKKVSTSPLTVTPSIITRMRKNGKTHEKTSFLTDLPDRDMKHKDNGAGASVEEEDSGISSRRDVKRKISNALNVGITAAKIASLFFTVSSLFYSATGETESVDDDIDEI